MSTLEGKVIWLTGASTGIGEALARELAVQTRCKLALSARRGDLLEKLASELRALGTTAHVFPADVADRVQMQTAGQAIENTFGPVDVLIANAGTHTPGRPGDVELENFKRIMEVNYFGVLNAIAAVLPAMRARRSGYIVGVSSVAGYRGLPGAAAYCASKAALTNCLESLRFDLKGFGIDVTVVSPGFVKTPLTDKNDFPMPFIISTEEAAKRVILGMERKVLEIHFPRRFTWLMKTLRVLPFPLYNWLVAKYVPVRKS